MADKHVLKLAPRRVYFRDPVSGLFLTYPQKTVGELPIGVDLKNIKRAVRCGELIDVNGTVLADDTQSAEKAVAVEQAGVSAEEVEQDKDTTKLAEECAVEAQEPAVDEKEENVEQTVKAEEDKKSARKKRR